MGRPGRVKPDGPRVPVEGLAPRRRWWDGDRVPEPRRPLTRGEWTAIAVAAIAAVVVGALWVRSRSPAEPPRPGGEAAAPPPAAPPEGGAPGAAPAAAVEPAQARAALEPASADPLYRHALAAEDPLRLAAVAIDNLSRDASPRKALAFLVPARPFTVADRGGARVVAPESYARYDRLAEAVASVDAGAIASAYRLLHPALEAAYRALGYPDARLDDAVARALRRVAAARVPQGELEVVPAKEGAGFEFADPALEALGPVEKHLLRLGPRNARRVQAKARELERALELPAPGAAR